MWWRFLVVLACVSGCAGERYAFFTKLHEGRAGEEWTRRVFGGRQVGRGTYPRVCLLLTYSYGAGCSCSVLAPRWALTAAHCATRNHFYVRYTRPNTNLETVPIHLLYMHPNYKVVERDEGAGMDVVTLHHDVGLVRTRRPMEVAPAPALPLPADPLRAMLAFDPRLMYGEEVDMVGFGKTERAQAGGVTLRAVSVRVASCERGPDSWMHCACVRGDGRGVCSGDSGGAVMFKGAQIGVTSMGPSACAAEHSKSAGGPTSVTSVFTSVHPYVEILNSTIYGLTSAMKMTPVKPTNVACAKRPAVHITLLMIVIVLPATLRHTNISIK